MSKNLNRVPKKQWKKWSNQARATFNRAYSFFHDNQSVVTHPKTPKMAAFQWKTVAWNAAWIAADACDDTVPTEVVAV